jgi:hypothetical protein
MQSKFDRATPSRSLFVRAARRAYIVSVRPLLRRLPDSLRKVMVVDLSSGLSLPATQEEPTRRPARIEPMTVPVFPSRPEEELYLAYLKRLLVERSNSGT